MNIDDSFLTLPSVLQPSTKNFWEDYQKVVSEEHLTLLAEKTTIATTLPRVWACSPFVAKQCLHMPDLLHELIKNSDERLVRLTEQPLTIPAPLETDQLMVQLRRYRQQEMVRIAWRDLANWASVAETLAALSQLADTLIETALQALYQQLTRQLGTPCDVQGEPQQLVVLALGKLGGQELNFSSDVDLIFAYPNDGETVGSGRSRSNQEFFLRLGQQLIHTLNHITAEGFVFRVDMRLRPFGDSGPLVLHFAAMEDYYQAHARDWERYALVKARVVAGDKAAGQALLQHLRPFIYRRYLDFNALEALRSMKALIDQETSRKGLNDNIKLGAGGIREIEFICQVFQLIRGGRQPALQQRHLLTALEKLQHYHILSAETGQQLQAAYRFLRLTENHLQAIDDRQTQNLPEDLLNQTRLAYSLGFSDWNNFLAQLIYHQQTVHREFQQVIEPDNQEVSQPTSWISHWQTLWLSELGNDERAETLLSVAGFQHPQTVLTQLRQLMESRSVRNLTPRGRERLDKLIPLLLATVSVCQYPDKAVQRTLELIEAIAQRSVYLALLNERPQILKQLVHLCAHSAWIAEQITRYPLLLDELLDNRRLYDPLQPEELDNALQAQLAHLPADDLEIQMDSLCQFKRAQVLHVAAAEICGYLSVEVASDYLAAIADTIVRRALSLAYDYLVAKHGVPWCEDDGQWRAAGFCIIGYGKAGGIELSYGSDLDIVFLHNSRGQNQVTQGDKPIDNQVFFMRLAQRIIHILTTNTPAGVLYDVDPRLRPGGASGLLVSSLDAFETYQHQNAWTWEHQALIRARALAGEAQCQNCFEQIRRSILSLAREPSELKQAVGDMRAKMRANLDKTTSEIFDLKQGHGGLTDIEFMVQYSVLRWAQNYPQLLETTGMLPLLRLFSEHQLMPLEACEQLSIAYRLYRAAIHRLALQNQAAQVDIHHYLEQREQVGYWWQSIMAG